jgi:hypothetical protein
MTTTVRSFRKRVFVVVSLACLATLAGCARKDKLAPCSPGDGIVSAFGSGVMALVPVKDDALQRASIESGPAIGLHVLSALRGPLPVTDAAVVDPCGTLRRIGP